MRNVLIFLAIIGVTMAVSVTENSAYVSFIQIAGVVFALMCIALYKLLDDKKNRKPKRQ